MLVMVFGADEYIDLETGCQPRPPDCSICNFEGAQREFHRSIVKPPKIFEVLSKLSATHSCHIRIASIRLRKVSRAGCFSQWFFILIALEKQHFTVVVKKDLQVLLNTIKNVNPLLIGISSDIDISFENSMRMLKLNKHTKNRCLFLLLDDDDEKDQNAFKLTQQFGITVFRGIVDPNDLARQITLLALSKKCRDRQSTEKKQS
ncbi:uncharacterized protein Dvar_04910 [Desulfosarcina variabilis str. Montpellier]|uniref:hypothetical protein n=1 Tax=Desulfosarcina variabilis TaxID=2300 RepID=UPI003AFA1EC5